MSPQPIQDHPGGCALPAVKQVLGVGSDVI
jgi:hypothetical protein